MQPQHALVFYWTIVLDSSRVAAEPQTPRRPAPSRKSTAQHGRLRLQALAERLQIRHALAHELFVHLDEVVLYAAGLCGAERLDPVDAALPDGLLRAASAAAGAAAWRGGHGRRNGRVHVEVLQ